jgi:hypothetical protein
MMGDRYERPEGSGKTPMYLEATFMQVLNNLVISKHAMTQSLEQMADRLSIGSIPTTHVPHAIQGNPGAGSRHHSPTRTYYQQV